MAPIRWWCWVPVLFATALSAQQAPPRDRSVPPVPTGTAVLSGTVVNDVSSRPVRRAVVTLSSADGDVRVSSVTDDTGVFTFRDLPAGRYYLGAAKPGYVGVTYGAKRVDRPGTTIAVADGEQRSGVTLRMPPGAVLAGSVRNSAGKPVPDARVVVLRWSLTYDTGERTLQPFSGNCASFGEITDDRGAYRCYGLPPDEYYVVVTAGATIRNATALRETAAAEVEWASRVLKGPGGAGPLSPAPEPGRAVDYAPVFYPGVVTQATASTVTVKEGEERAGVDVMLDLVPMATLTGTVVLPGDTLPPNLQVNVVAHDTIPGIAFSGFGNARVDRNGRFRSPGLSPGDYTITVRTPASPGGRNGASGVSASALFGTTAVTINGADVDTTVTLESGVSVSGRLIFNGSSLKPPADLSKIRVSLTAERSKTPTLGVPAALTDDSGAFAFVGVTPGRYRLMAYAGGWEMLSAVVGGHDALDEAVEITKENVSGAEITFTDQKTEISGSLLDATGHPAPEYSIIAFPVDRTYWRPLSRRIQSVRPASDGHFLIRNLPPGEYQVAAVTDVQQGEWFDPSFLAELVGAAKRITLAAGEKRVQDLKIAGGSWP
jgi:Carboxypeptidase regulatory-like domain